MIQEKYKMKKRVLIFGGRGFLGRAVARELSKKWVVFSSDRHKGPRSHIMASVTDKEQVDKAIKKSCADYVVNLVGLTPLRKPKHSTYQDVHVNGVENIVGACKKYKVKKLIHVSALGADSGSSISYIKTKGQANELISASGLKHTIMKPSILFGEGGEIIKQLDKALKVGFFPKLKSVLAPVYVGDVARLISLALQDKVKEKEIEIGGPEEMSMFELAEKYFKHKGRKIKPVPLFLVKTGVLIMALLHLGGIGFDQYRFLDIDNAPKINHAGKYIKLTGFEDWLQL